MQVGLDSGSDSGVERQIAAYLDGVLKALPERTRHRPATTDADPVESVFELLTSRRYSHLGRTKAEPYRARVSKLLQSAVSRSEPMRFFYDLGSGYHASLAPGRFDLSFDPGLGELLALHSVVSFCNEAQRRYGPGARFHLVIDNLCGWATNDVPLDRLEAFAGQLRQLIRNVGADDLVAVLVESENATEYEYLSALAQIEEEPYGSPPTAAQIENVARFLGRECTSQEAGLRIEQYRRTTIATEALLARAIDGVRLTQRAGPMTVGFRAFAGGDQRIQAGQVVFRVRRARGIKPFLLTSRNVDRFRLDELDVSGILPGPISRVGCVVPSDGQSTENG